MITQIYIILDGHAHYNDAQTMVQVFYPNSKYVLADTAYVADSGLAVKSSAKNGVCTATVYENGTALSGHTEASPSSDEKSLKNTIKISIYKALSAHTGYTPKWGILTGIRPAKLASLILASGKSRDDAMAIFMNEYLVSKEKALLALNVSENASAIMRNKSSTPRFHLYVGIPFCPTRCLYCSFTSYPISKHDANEYIACLKMEIARLPDAPLSSIYIGGGTPTSLNEAQLTEVLDAIYRKFSEKTDFSKTEFTVEAGRPDTITAEKLDIMRRFNVDRISINPQTMNDETLLLIGRRHTASDIADAFALARRAGFKNINMDLIVGLPNETPEMTENTMRRIYDLSPDSITVHTLAVKRASVLYEQLCDNDGANGVFAPQSQIEEMLGITRSYAEKMEMLPYSMYRNKNMLGNFENVGYCKEGAHSVFNIETLEETATVLAVGAGAITKNVDGEKITRKFNAKNIDDYMSNVKR